jgi:hypothetical protein
MLYQLMIDSREAHPLMKSKDVQTRRSFSVRRKLKIKNVTIARNIKPLLFHICCRYCISTIHLYPNPVAEFMNVQLLSFLDIILRVLRLEVSV